VGIVDEDIERVRGASPLDVIVGEHVALRRVGARYVGLCPFHTEKTPSFSVNSEAGFWHCFGCSASGDAIDFVRETQHLDFVGAVEWLAGRAGIQLRYDDARQSRSRRRRQQLVDAMAAAVDWYHERLLRGEDARAARSYLRSRGYDGDVVRRYRLGWAPGGWDELTRALRLPADVLRATGLAFVNSRDRLQDSFRERVLFPIFDARGDPVALGGRVLPGTDGHKYKNSPATALYDKGEVLYGLNWAKADAAATGEVVVCEGYTDVIGFAQAGVPRAVGICGTALTERHVAALRNFARRVVLAFDADGAGRSAADRFYEWEERLGVDVAVAALPPGSDPGELAGSDPEALRKAVADARPYLAYRLDRLLDGATLSTPEGRARAAAAARAMIAVHPNQIVREQYAGHLAARLDVAPEHLLRGQGAERGTPSPAPSATPRRRSESPAALALRLATQHPEAVEGLLHEVLFDDEVERRALRVLGGAATLADAVAGADPEAAELLRRAAVEEVDADAHDVVALLVADAAGRELRRLERAARDAPDPLGYQADVAWLKLRTEELWLADTRPAAIGQLVAFLAERGQEGT
jgi:DNA primase